MYSTQPVFGVCRTPMYTTHGPDLGVCKDIYVFYTPCFWCVCRTPYIFYYKPMFGVM